MDKIQALGASVIFLIDYFPVEAGDEQMQCLTDEDQEMKKRELLKRKKDSGLVIINLPMDESRDGLCAGGGNGLIHIDASGRLGPCPFSNQAKDNVLEKDYIDILKSEVMASFRRKASGQLNRPGRCFLAENGEIFTKKEDTGIIRHPLSLT